MQELIRQTEQSLDTILQFYDDKGARLSYRPVIKYVDSFFQPSPDTIGLIGGGFDFTARYLEVFLRNFGKILWKELYGLKVSDGACEELAIAENKLRLLLVQEECKDPQVDIFLFLPYSKLSDKRKYMIISHEVWHLIEKERGAMGQPPLISEGTATYASMKCTEAAFGLTASMAAVDILEAMYNAAATIVRVNLENTENPLLSLFETSVRNEMEMQLLTQVNNSLRITQMNILEETAGTVYYGLLGIILITKFLAPHQTNKNAKPKNILEAYRRIQATRLVEELQGQNLECLVDRFRSALNSMQPALKSPPYFLLRSA